MRSFASELGLTPSARSRIQVSKEGNTKEQDPMELILAGIPKGDELMQ